MVSVFEPATKTGWYQPQIPGSRGKEQVLKEISLGDEEWKRTIGRQL